MSIKDYLSKFRSIESRGTDSHFISFEGIDGSGKSTQINLFKKKLETMSYKVHYFREPGATFLGEKLREVILESNSPMSSLSEAFIFLASRIQNINENILPLMKENKSIVLMDRFIDSTLAYQCYGGSLSLESLLKLHTLEPLFYTPDLTYWLDIDFEKSLKRRSKRDEEEDYFEKRKDQFMIDVSDGYHQISNLFPERIKRIQAEQNIDSVAEEIELSWKNYHANS